MVIVHSIIGQLCLRGRAWVGSSSTPRISVHNGTVRVQKLALREGYASAGRAIPRRGPSPAVSQKYHPPVPSFALFLSLSPLSRLRVTRAAASLDYLRVAARSASHPAPDNVLCSFFSFFRFCFVKMSLLLPTAAPIVPFKIMRVLCEDKGPFTLGSCFLIERTVTKDRLVCDPKGRNSLFTDVFQVAVW